MDQMVNGTAVVDTQENPVPEITSVQKEKRYANIQKLIASTGCIVQYELKLYVYNMIIKRLTRLGDYRDCVELVNQYTELVEKTEREGKEEIYQKMLSAKKNVTKAEDIQWVLKEAERIPGYKDTEDVVKWCEDEFARMQKKEQHYAMIRLSIIIILLIVLVFAARYGLSLLGR